LAEYERAPGVTRERLYIETIERVLRSSRKVLLDTKGDGGNLVYLPIEKLFDQSRRAPSVQPSDSSMTIEGRTIEAGTSDATGTASERRTRGSR
jgi:membrane protease subunit HflK